MSELELRPPKRQEFCANYCTRNCKELHIATQTLNSGPLKAELFRTR
jgi:hypothetical protein